MTLEAVGIDIGRGAWAVARIRRSARGRVEALEGGRLPFERELVAGGDAWVVIDIPIGLVDAGAATRTPTGVSGDREVDKGARRWCLSSGSIFPPPTTEQLASALAEHQRAARATAAGERRRSLSRVAPRGLSRQSLELAPAIDAARRLATRRPGRVFESHPEVAFAAIAGGILPAAKRSVSGARVRAGLLRERLGVDAWSWARALERATSVPVHDWLDALVMAVVAADFGAGTRNVLRSRDGAVHPWAGERGGVLALPATTLCGPPARLTEAEAETWASRASGP